MKEEWGTVRLGKVCDIIGGGTPSKSNIGFYKGDIPWVTVRDMNCDYLVDTEFRITTDAVKNSATHIIPQNSVIIATRVGLGKVCILAKDSAINQDLKGILPKRDKILDQKYLFWWFKSVSQKILEAGTGATVQGVKLPFIQELPFPYRPLPEQKRIVAILDETFAAIGKAKAIAEKNLQNARELFESYLQGVFEKKGEEWIENKLGDVYDVRDGTHDSPKFQQKGFPLITSKNIKKDLLNYKNVNYISEQDYININKRSKVDKGDVLFAMIGTIGNPVVIQDEPDFAIKNVALFKVPNVQNSKFLKYYLDTKSTIDKMMGDAKGTTQKFVSLGYLREFKILLPTLKEQQTIVSYLDAFRAETKKLETVYQKKIDDMDELKKSVLQKAFTGELSSTKAIAV